MKHRTWMIPAGAFCFVAAACGGSDDPPTDASSPTPTASAVTSPTPQATPTSSPTTPAATQTATPPAGQVSPEAVAVVLRYYRAINDGDYAAAYALWADGGAASGQSAYDFAEGFLTTERTVPLVTGVAAPGEVQVVVRAIETVSESTQAVVEYRGVYTVQDEGDGWRITAAEIEEVSPPSGLPSELTDPATLIAAYGDAIAAGDLATAFSYWEGAGAASGQTYPEFAAGFEQTADVDIHVGDAQQGGAAGSLFATVPAVLVSTLDDGTTTVFCGTYDARRANIRPFDELGWHLYGAEMAQVPGATSADADALLANGCTA
ncbi:MAG: nuclear transport factor 2 family protein [Dehalococcoidia bacterium]|nr:nuclear transport factor 2 family protein [Dehalococcoidia bacterium]